MFRLLCLQNQAQAWNLEASVNLQGTAGHVYQELSGSWPLARSCTDILSFIHDSSVVKVLPSPNHRETEAQVTGQVTQQ